MKAVYCPYCGGRAKCNGRTSSWSRRWRRTARGASMTVRCDDTAAGLGEFLGRFLSKGSQATMPGGGRSFRRRTAEFREIWPTLAPDGGGGFAKAVRESWPQTMVRRCLWHAFSQENRHTTSRPRLRAGIELRGLAVDLMHVETLREAGQRRAPSRQIHRLKGPIHSRQAQCRTRPPAAEGGPGGLGRSLP